MTGFLAPMLASALPEGRQISDYAPADYAAEWKVDGQRRVIEVADTVTAWSRVGNVLPLPTHITDAVRRLARGTYDAELYVPNGTATDVKKGTRQAETRLVLFDLLRVGPQEIVALPGTERRDCLVYAASQLPAGGPVTVIDQFDPSADLLAAIWHAKLEGLIVKRRSATYRPGVRSPEWVKLKKFLSTPVTITGFEAGKLGPHSKILSVDADGVVVKVKSLNDAWRADFAHHAERYIGRTMMIAHQGKAAGGVRYKSAMADHILG